MKTYLFVCLLLIHGFVYATDHLIYHFIWISLKDALLKSIQSKVIYWSECCLCMHLPHIFLLHVSLHERSDCPIDRSSIYCLYTTLFISEVCCPIRSNHCSYLKFIVLDVQIIIHIWKIFKIIKIITLNRQRIHHFRSISIQSPLWQIFGIRGQNPEKFRSKSRKNADKMEKKFRASSLRVRPSDTLLTHSAKLQDQQELLLFLCSNLPQLRTRGIW